MTTQEEQWRAVLGFEQFYEVSDRGRVRATSRKYAGRILKPCKHAGGYQVVYLTLDGRGHARTIHRLVLEAFVSVRPDGKECRHLDNDRANNRLVNLAWATHTENESDKLIFGTRLRGRHSPVAKLTEEQVRCIRMRSHEPQAALAAEYGCTFSNISAIQRRVSWRHV